MKNINHLTLILLMAIVIMGCNNSKNTKVSDTTTQTYHELEKANWLIGKWQNNSSEGTATEIWEKENDSTLAGKSYFVIVKDTVSSEKISLIQANNKLFYIPTVKEQNGGQPVRFTGIASSENQLVFENPQHDFPQKITYTKLGSDSVIAEISGMIDGKQTIQQFPFTRVK